MSEAALLFYEKEFKKYSARHQTVNDGDKEQFVCFSGMKEGIFITFDTPYAKAFKFCPLCGEKLSEPVDVKDGKKTIWK